MMNLMETGMVTDTDTSLYITIRQSVTTKMIIARVLEVLLIVKYRCLSFNLPEAWTEMDRHVFVPLLEPVVFTNVMQVITTNNDGALHLHLEYDSRKDTTTDRHVSSEGAFLVDVSTIDSLQRNSPIKTISSIVLISGTLGGYPSIKNGNLNCTNGSQRGRLK